jgi:hypothetical protein
MLTSMAYDFLKPDLDDDTRAEQIQQALEAREPATGALVAAALIDAGPDVAQALPTNNREALIDGLVKGMEQAAGPLAQIAPRYTAGLRDPQTDWAALQTALRQVVEQTAMTMQVGNKGQIRDAAMEVEGVGGNVEMKMTAGDEGVIQGVRMSRSGGHAPATAAAQQCPDCGAPITASQAICPRCGVKLVSAA